jgi:hypothetical protein
VRLDEARQNGAAAGVDARRVVAKPGRMTRAASRTGGAPVPSISWPLVMTVVPVAVFMAVPSRVGVRGAAE